MGLSFGVRDPPVVGWLDDSRSSLESPSLDWPRQYVYFAGSERSR